MLELLHIQIVKDTVTNMNRNQEFKCDRAS